ncbi:MAG: hypothetical protein IIW86_01725 [Clostridia bacterium]|jgi:uncharacterized protein YqgQ|nr:hypothetical protein [Clostridia bacterium]
MDWVQIIQVFLLPAFGYLIYLYSRINDEIASLEKDMSDFKLKVAEEAKNYATNEAILRMENKIDDLRNLIIDRLQKQKARK